LYYQVPGWPIGFGDKKQAEALLKQAVAINPDGIDANFFYGDFLLNQGRKAEAKTYLQKAMMAQPRPGRELADKGRRQEIQQRLDKL
jgi:Tfp pilus assembly protein PilF